MALDILFDKEKKLACFQNTKTDRAFGPLAYGRDADIQLISFAKWLDLEPEEYERDKLEDRLSDFRSQYLERFREWVADAWDEIGWENVGEWMSRYEQALEEAHAPYKFEGPVGP